MDKTTKEFVLRKIADKKETFEIDSNIFKEHWNYRYKFQVRGPDLKTGVERWVDASKYKFLYPEQINEDGMKYLLYKNNKSDKLIIIFQAINRNPTYNYVGLLKDIEANRLYIKDDYGKDSATRSSYYLGENKNLDISNYTQKLIEEVTKDLNVKKENTIFAGSSKGGFSAIYHGYLFGAGHILPGGPQILLGDYLYGNHEEKSIGQKIFKSVVGELNQENKEWANKLILDVLGKASTPYPSVNIHVGYWEPHFKNHVHHFLFETRSLGIENVNVDLGNYGNHNDLPVYYPPFLKKELDRILNQNK